MRGMLVRQELVTENANSMQLNVFAALYSLR